MGVKHRTNDADSNWSTWSFYLLDQFLILAYSTLIDIELFNVLLDLSYFYFARFNGFEILFYPAVTLSQNALTYFPESSCV